MPGNPRILAASPAYLMAHGHLDQSEEQAQHNYLMFAYSGLLQNTGPLRKGRREKSVTVGGTLYSFNVCRSL
ncbi:hypothetical protein [Xanthomonas theicola]|uniref:hypothetical protein n=1 Tax=Xanthomonas theicola TaxID=56464 RepID=UPI00130484E6|nr:hypothetical protein [Xanthomonas theicola]QNH24238.1 hypothetical protein G4Q83_05000 [Xanthomonas theicola]